MKKVFIPSMDELYQMQKIVGSDNLYRYLLAKTVESLIVNKKSDKGILEGVSKALKDNYYISKAITYLYPSEVIFSETVSFDKQLVLDILDKNRTSQIYNIDEIRQFDSSTLYMDTIIKRVTSLLKKELINCPQYRFEYLDNPLLDSIFGVDIDSLKGYNYNTVFDELTELIEIEPAYGILLPDGDFHSDANRKYMLIQGMNVYLGRYQISTGVGLDYYGQDILSNPDTNVKRLLRCINDRNK